MADPAPAPRRYPKPLVLPDKLEYLMGPTSGTVALPRHIDWAGRASYDLDQPGRILDLYRTVISEATKPADLYSYLDKATLIRLWPQIWMSPDVRTRWEERFPELRGASSRGIG